MTAEQAAFLEQFFKAHFSELQVHAFRFLGDWKNTEGVVMDAFEIACEKIDTFLECKNQIGWMKSVVQNVCRNSLRRRSRDAMLLLAWEDITEGQLPGVEDTHPSWLVEECKALLSQEEFSLLYQAVVLDVPYDELARTRGITMWACRKRVQRTLAKLRKFFDKNDF